jgi:homoserine kinase
MSNLGSGFDILGISINVVSDEIIIEKREDKEIVIKEIFPLELNIPKEIEKNTCGFAVKQLLEKYQVDCGIDITIYKKLGIGSGLGSSASSAVAGVFAANELFNLKIKKQELIYHALEGEKIASKAIHADNVAPCLYGGVVLINSYNPLNVIALPYPEDLFFTLIYPDIEIKTSQARSILPGEISFKDAVFQTGKTAGLISGFYQKDIQLISDSIQDKLAEPYRKHLIPHYGEMKEIAFDNGAYAFNISGSGPTVFAVSDNISTAELIGNKVQEYLYGKSIGSNSYISSVNPNPPKVIG